MRYRVGYIFLSALLCVGLTGIGELAAKTSNTPKSHKTAVHKTTKSHKTAVRKASKSHKTAKSRTAAKSSGLTEAQKAAGRKRLKIDANGDKPLQPFTQPTAGGCTAGTRNGFPIPDPSCTPGAVNPTLTIDVLTNPKFTTKLVRDEATGPTEKAGTYNLYGIKHPKNNTGSHQVCELDHFVSLEIGGADTLDNIWPQCGPSKAVLKNRYFKQKDTVENYLAWLAKFRKMDLPLAQTCIAHDWTQFLDKAKKSCPGGVCPKSAPTFTVTQCQK